MDTQIPQLIQENFTAADPIARRIDQTVDGLATETTEVLRGKWLGHPLHPMLTDLPIGFWTTSFVLDFVGRRARRTSTAMVGLGVASAIPTIVTGLAEFPTLPEEKKRAGVAHMVCNATATVLYAMSFVSRLKGKRFSGFALGLLGATAATAGGYLGGHLAFGRSVGAQCLEVVARLVDHGHKGAGEH